MLASGFAALEGLRCTHIFRSEEGGREETCSGNSKPRTMANSSLGSWRLCGQHPTRLKLMQSRRVNSRGAATCSKARKKTELQVEIETQVFEVAELQTGFWMRCRILGRTERNETEHADNEARTGSRKNIFSPKDDQWQI